MQPFKPKHSTAALRHNYAGRTPLQSTKGCWRQTDDTSQGSDEIALIRGLRARKSSGLRQANDDHDVVPIKAAIAQTESISPV